MLTQQPVQTPAINKQTFSLKTSTNYAIGRELFLRYFSVTIIIHNFHFAFKLIRRSYFSSKKRSMFFPGAALTCCYVGICFQKKETQKTSKPSLVHGYEVVNSDFVSICIGNYHPKRFIEYKLLFYVGEICVLKCRRMEFRYVLH